MFDIDRFKAINDAHGHLAGDMVLRELAGLLRAVVRKDELLARYGGEEFAMVLPETAGEQAVQACERLRADGGRAPRSSTTGTRIPVTVSVGVAVSTADTDRRKHLIRAADAKLYEAKAAGRNRVAF